MISAQSRLNVDEPDVISKTTSIQYDMWAGNTYIMPAIEIIKKSRRIDNCGLKCK